MSAITRFVSLGLRDADHRIAAALTPRPLGPIDRYLGTSVIVAAIDRASVALSVAWQESRAGRIAHAMAATVSREAAGARAVGVALLIAVAVHVTLTLVQGPRPGWFWMLIPGMVGAVGVLLLAGVRPARRT